MSKLMRRTIDTLLPPGSAWSPAPDGDFDKLLDGMAANWETIRLFLADLKNVRDPHTTSFLADLEREYGVLTNLTLTEEQRRAALSPLVYNRGSTGSIDAMCQALNDAGFDVQVHENSPAVDPAIFIDQQFQSTLGSGDAYLGNAGAFFGRVGGEWLINGDIFETTRLFTSGLGTAYLGADDSLGEYDELQRTKIEYLTPADPDAWPFVVFVGGDATRNVNGELTDIELANIPNEQESDFKRIILKYKPIHIWVGLITTYV